MDLHSISSIIVGVLLYPLYIFGIDSFISRIRDVTLFKTRDPGKIRQVVLAFFFIFLIVAIYALRLIGGAPFKLQRVDLLFAIALLLWVAYVPFVMLSHSAPAAMSPIDESDKTSVTYLSALLGRRIVNAVLLVTLLGALCIAYGNSQASRQTAFFTIDTDPDFVGIKIYGVKLIGASPARGVVRESAASQSHHNPGQSADNSGRQRRPLNLERHNKSLELTPWRPFGAGGAFPQSVAAGAAAAQLNSMLCTNSLTGLPTDVTVGLAA